MPYKLWFYLPAKEYYFGIFLEKDLLLRKQGNSIFVKILKDFFIQLTFVRDVKFHFD